MRFPLKTALAFAVCLLALAVFHRRSPGKGLSASVFREAVSFRSLHPRLAAPPAATIPPPIRATHGRPPLSDFLFDDSGSLDPFFTSLAKLEAGKGGGSHVAILHYGDSPTTADLITGDVRALLQQRFGNAGDGYLLVAKPWAWYGHRDTDLSGHGWTISTAVGKMRAEAYGLGGGSFQGASGAGSTITLRGAAQSAMELAFLAQPGGGSLSISVDDDAGKDQPVATVDTAVPDESGRRPAWQTIPLPPGTSAVDIRPVSGHVEVFGETFTRAQSGILYDSLGLNGASTTVLSRGFDPGVWAAELRHDSPALVVINYGTNESGFGSFVDRQYEGELRIAIQRIRNALPNVSILIMSPMDRGEHVGIDEIQTMNTIPRIVAIQRRVALEQRCAFFDTFDAMGGEGTMSRWYNGKPRLVAADFIHPTPQGASIVAQIFVKNLMQGYDGFKAHPAGSLASSPPSAMQLKAGKPSVAQPEAKQVTQR